ncbi:MAG: hypothetical protein LBR68_00740 [Lachnoclostridium sp.]|jgi:spore germination protein YaaH|nr:hypothetical protein [Lachnoclostridium sp.]
MEVIKQRARIIGIISVVVLVLVLISAVYFYLAPSRVKREMSEQYPDLAKDERLMIVGDTVLENRAIDKDGQIYLPIESVSKSIYKRFFWDDNENILTCTLPDQVVMTSLNQKSYQTGSTEETTDYPIVIQKLKKEYVALDFLYKFIDDKKITVHENPRRLVTKGESSVVYPVAVLNNSSRLRVGAGKKYDYLLDLNEGQEVYVRTESSEDYQMVMTMDGIEGYILKEDMDEQKQKNFEEGITLPVYEQMQMDEQICMAWHQVTTDAANAYLSSVTANVRGLNVISPTWYALSDNKGNFTSLANSTYVQTAHSKGYKVWALIDDFAKGVNLRKLLGRTSTRQQLINNLIASAIQYGIDGINIDFEGVNAKSAEAYLSFLRELAIKCHNNQLVLSADNYMPADYHAHYDLEEQGKVLDYVVFMGYDEHYSGSEEAGSVSSINFIKTGLDNIEKAVPKERVIMALPFYTRLWCEKQSKSGVIVSSTAHGMDEAKGILNEHGANTEWDEETAQYYSEYKSGNDTYKIWLEEERSLSEKLIAVQEKQMAGVAFWKLGFERAGIWSVIEQNIG